MEPNSLTAYTPLSARLKALGNLIACVIECKCVCEGDRVACKCVKVCLSSLPCTLVCSGTSLGSVLKVLKCSSGVSAFK